jgi:hypothetical protein
MFTQMKETIMSNLGSPPVAYVNSETIDTSNTFDAEEDIRNIITSEDARGCWCALTSRIRSQPIRP